MTDRIIYGKAPEEKIVSIEIKDDAATLFIQKDDGNVTIKEVPNRYWILSSQPLGKGWSTLKGDLHYKYGKQYLSRNAFSKERSYFKKSNLDIFSIWNPKEAFMVKDGYTYLKGLKHNEVTCLSFDIETTSIDHTDDAKLLLISNTGRKNGVLTRKLFSYDDYQSEGAMIEDWCKWVREYDPSLLIGHNIVCFDLPYIQFIADRENVSVDLGRNGSSVEFDRTESKFRKDGSQHLDYFKAHVYGREIIDTMFLAYKYDAASRKYESYGLKNIIKQEGWEQEGRVFYDASQIRHNYKDPVEWEKIKQYCEFDADDSLKLYDKMIAPFFYMTQSIPKPFQLIIESATGSQINAMMIRSYLQEGHSLPKADEMAAFSGAHSGGIPGVYKNCIKWDVASLYPSIMIEYKVYNPKKDPQGNFLKLVEIFTEERLKNKKLFKETQDPYYDDLQAAQKTAINSMYGFMGATGLLFNSLEHAAFVTTKGREILEAAVKWATGKELNSYVQP